MLAKAGMDITSILRLLRSLQMATTEQKDVGTSSRLATAKRAIGVTSVMIVFLEWKSLLLCPLEMCLACIYNQCLLMAMVFLLMSPWLDLHERWQRALHLSCPRQEHNHRRLHPSRLYSLLNSQHPHQTLLPCSSSTEQSHVASSLRKEHVSKAIVVILAMTPCMLHSMLLLILPVDSRCRICRVSQMQGITLPIPIMGQVFLALARTTGRMALWDQMETAFVAELDISLQQVLRYFLLLTLLLFRGCHLPLKLISHHLLDCLVSSMSVLGFILLFFSLSPFIISLSFSFMLLMSFFFNMIFLH